MYAAPTCGPEVLPLSNDSCSQCWLINMYAHHHGEARLLYIGGPGLANPSFTTKYYSYIAVLLSGCGGAT